MLTPDKIHQDIKDYNMAKLEIVKKNPWIVPAVCAWMVIPVVVSAHGFWKDRQLKKQLKIEREKTKQLALEHDKKLSHFAYHSN